MNLERKSSLYILVACLLWALDLLVRYPISLKMGYVSIVFIESFIGLFLVTPWLIKNGRKELAKFSKNDWILAVFLGGIGMSVAGYLSTACIQKASPGTFSFFQIFQPFFVIFMAGILLKEKLDNQYLYWGIWVLLSAVLIFSQDLELMFTSQEMIVGDFLIALSTMLIWGLCTIAAKKLLQKHSPEALVAVRWAFAFIFAVIILLGEKERPAFDILFQWEVGIRFLFIGAIAGIASMYFYYSGLKNLPAGKVSIFELSFPAFGMIFSAIYTFESLTIFQIVGATSFFMFILFMLSRQESERATVKTR
ncbi:DMT family transporter [Peredibacter starrii]|uniref:DMT family transporter n=1 Tax=Peredibacter starrii TaxID=28202 RepID=A0AAX4HUS0_9BACT|nr:DMT family transporter [Peredibacter starrii]WPU66938.1 DMT family transporter [Peredibacter starrii]